MSRFMLLIVAWALALVQVPSTSNSIVAWGDNRFGQCSVPQYSDYTAVTAGSYHSLGLRSSGKIVAWGWNDDGQCNVPSPNGQFKAVAGGGRHSLGLKADGSI